MDNGKVGRKMPGTATSIPGDGGSVEPKKPSDSQSQTPGEPSPLSDRDKAQLKGMHAFDGDMKKASLTGKSPDLKAKIQEASKSKWDGVSGLSKSEYEAIKNDYQNKSVSPETVKWMEKEHPYLHASIVSDLDYSGFVGTSIGSLNFTRAGEELKDDAARRSAKLNQLPHTSEFRQDGLHKSAPPGDPVPPPEPGETWKEYQTGQNKTYVKNDSLSNIKDDQAKESRKTQADFCTKMSGIIGTDIPNPPSTKAAQAYFQGMADRGASPAQIKDEYGKYLSTFYRHPGGVKWNPELDPKNLDANFGSQPVAKDGKRLIDCEGYAAVTEKVLGNIKKDGKPMFDIMHGSGPGHVFTGVFPHGGDPRKGFIVNNDQIQDVKWDSRHDKGFSETKGTEARERFIVREHWKQQFGEKSSTTEYGTTYTKMSPPSGKVPGQ